MFSLESPHRCVSNEYIYMPFSVYKRKSPEIILNLQPWNFSKGLKNEFEKALVNEQSVSSHRRSTV